MCLGIPGKVVETFREHDVPMGKVDFSGVSKRVCLEHVPSVRPGDYVLLHGRLCPGAHRRGRGPARVRVPGTDEPDQRTGVRAMKYVDEYREGDAVRRLAD